MFKEILLIAFKQCGDVVLDKIELASNGLQLARFQTANAKIGMKAAGNSLKEFLIWLSCHGKDHLFVGTESADKSITCCLLGDGTRINVS